MAAEIRRGIGADNRVERLPWLEPVEDEDDYPEAGGGGRRWAVVGLGLLLLLALAIVGVVAFRHWRGGREDLGGIIRAPEAPYKVRPANAGGLAVDASGMVAERTGTGADIDAPLALVAPEQPIVGPGSHAVAAGEPAPAPATRPQRVILAAPPKPAAPAPKGIVTPPPAEPVTSGGTVQLGAFGSEAKARTAWKSLSRRFSYLQPMAISITAAEVNGTTLYRLRASGGEPSQRVCARLQLAGEACAVIG